MPTPSCYTSRIGDAIGVGDGEPYWNGLKRQWLLWVNFQGGCTSNDLGRVLQILKHLAAMIGQSETGQTESGDR
ncbi:MAG: hypothetical protein ICV63_21980 [Coleofasciculus sp. Co-bin14]|nr:hypothetical protein [Coleofasciculus sp. Co-bin14]